MSLPSPFTAWEPLWERLVKPEVERRQPSRWKGAKLGGSGWIDGYHSPLRDDKTPSFSIHPDSETDPGAWKDHATGDGGSMADLARQLGLDLRGSIRALPQPAPPPKDLAEFAARRRLDPERLRNRWGVSDGIHAGRAALLYPVPKGPGRIKYLDGQKPKYRYQAKGGKNQWFGLTQALERPGGPVYVVGGEFDVMAADQAGVPAICCFGEGSAPSEAMAEELIHAAIGELRIVYDLDEAGIKGAKKALAILRAAGLKATAYRLPENLGAGGDVDDLHRQAGDEDLAAALAALPLLPEPDERAPETTRRGRPAPALPAGRDCEERVPRSQPLPAHLKRLADTPWFYSQATHHLLSRFDLGEENAFSPEFPWSIAVSRIVLFPEEQAPEGQRTYFEIAIAGEDLAPEPQLVAWRELQSKDWPERWGTLGIGSSKTFGHLSAAVQGIAGGTGAEQVKGYRRTGWQERDGSRLLTLPDGRAIGPDGLSAKRLFFMRLDPHHVEPYRTLPLGDRPLQEEALAFVAGVAQESIGALVLAAHLASLCHDIVPPDFSLVLRAESGCGKTSLASWARNVAGNFPWPAVATASFTETTTSLEDSLGQVASLPMMLDDLAIKDAMPQREKDERARQFEGITRSVGNNAPVRRRMRAGRNGIERGVEHRINGCPVITAEQLPVAMASALNRTVLLSLSGESVDLAAMKHRSASLMPGLRTAGHAFIAHVASRWSEDGQAFESALRERMLALEKSLEEKVPTLRGARPIPSDAVRLPHNGAHLLAMLGLFQDACTAQGLAFPLQLGAILDDLAVHLSRQIDTIGAVSAGGSSGAADGAWVCRIVRDALGNGEAHVLSTESGIPKDSGQPLERLGFALGRLGEYERQGKQYLGAITNDGAHLALDKFALASLLERAARREKWEWSLDAVKLPAHLLDLAILTPDNDGRHLERQTRIGSSGKRRWCHIACALIWPDAEEDAPEEETDPQEAFPWEPI